MTGSQQSNQENPSPLTQLRQQMAAYFSLEEIQTLCFDLHVNYDELPNPGLTPKIRDLILLMKQNGSINELHTAVSQTRPHITWPSLADLEADTLTDADSLTSPALQVIVSAQGEGATAVGPRGVYVGGDVHGNIHTGDVINYYVTGTQTFFPQFTVGVQNFLTNYLGTDKKPVPFGGRDQQLAQLDNWLNQKEIQRLLLVAPAGRGKSALLVRWSQQFIKADNLAVIFMPISLRFNTNREDNTFIILATRLAHFYGKQIPISYANQSPQMWRGLVAEYLREPLPDGRQLLLILDGLDEAAWDVAADLLPMNLPAATRVIASARYLGGEEQSPEPWLRRLGWDSLLGLVQTIELEKLTQDGVRDVLQKMGCPMDELGRNVDIVAELYRLSEGDPLLVELYIKELWQRGEAAAQLKPEDLQNIEPGYKGYFDRWWAEQKRLWGAERPLQEQLVRAILNLLTIAYGPLLIEDIQELLLKTMVVDSILIREAVTPLARFVIGDGQEQGFAFSHPKLTGYFREQLTQRDWKMWQVCFLVWGEQALVDLQAKKVKPYEVSLYLMLYYGRHLEEAYADVEGFLQLVSWEWMQVWHKKTGNYAGFLQDVDRVWLRLRVVNTNAINQEKEAPYIGKEILCGLCHASVNGLVNNIPSKLLTLLLQHKVWTEEQVVAYIRQRAVIRKNNEEFALVWPYLSAATQKAAWQEILPEVRAMDNEEDQAYVLVNVAPYLPQEVLLAACEIINEWYRGEVLSALAPYLPHETLKAAQKIDSGFIQEKVLTALAPYLPQETLAAASAIREETYRAIALLAVAPYLPQETLKAAQKINSEWSKVMVLSAVATCLSQGLRLTVLEEILSTVRKITDKEDRADALVRAIFPHMLPGECNVLAKEALTIALEIWDVKLQAELMVSVAPHLPNEVLAATRKLDNDWSRSRILIASIPYFHEDAKIVLEEALTAAMGIHNKGERSKVLAAIASHLPHEVFVAAQEIPYEGDRVKVLVALAPFLPQETLTAAKDMRDPGRRADVLVALAPFLPQKALMASYETGDPGSQAKLLVAVAPYLPREALAAAQEIRNDSSRADVLEAVAPYLPKEILVNALENAFGAAQEMRDEGIRIEILEAFAPYLPSELVEAAFDAALAEVREIRDELRRADFLRLLVPHLPHETLMAAMEITDERRQADVLMAVAAHLPHETLKVVQEMTHWISRVRVLTAIALYLPEELLNPVLEDLLVEALKINDVWSRAYALTQFAPHFPQEALKAVQEIYVDGNGIRVNTLVAVAPYLPQETLKAAWKIRDEGVRTKVLIAVAPHLPQEAWVAAQGMRYEENRADVLVAVAPHLPEETLTVAQEMSNSLNRARVLVAVVPYLQQETRMTIIAELLAMRRATGNEEVEQIKIVVDIVPYLSEEVRMFMLEEVLVLLRETSHMNDHADTLADLINHLLIFSQSHLYKLWQETLLANSQRKRHNLLSNLKPLMPIIHRLGGEKGVRDTWQAVQTVSAWWP